MRVNVSEVMTRAVVSVRGDTSYKEVAELLIAHGVSAVPVLDTDGHVIGVVSEADLLLKEEFRRQYYPGGHRPPLRARRPRLDGQGGGAGVPASADGGDGARGDTAADLMTSPAVTVRPEQATTYAMRLMEGNGVKRLPVVDREGRLVGIVSRRDLLKLLTRPDAEIAREVRQDVLGRYLRTDTSRIEVSVNQGVVRLAGRTGRRSDARAAAHMSVRVNGVVDVVDELEWDDNDIPAREDR